jgi:hypothetical protein
MTDDFSALIARAAKLRITEAELIALCGITPSRYSRAKNGVTGTSAMVRVLRDAEAMLDELEMVHQAKTD